MIKRKIIWRRVLVLAVLVGSAVAAVVAPDPASVQEQPQHADAPARDTRPTDAALIHASGGGQGGSNLEIMKG